MKRDDQLTEDRINRLIIKEKPSGVPFSIEVKPMGITDSSGEHLLRLSYSVEGVKDLVGSEREEKIRRLANHPQLSKLILNCYLCEETALEGAQICLDGIDSELLNGARATLPMEQIDSIAMALSFLPSNYIMMPVSLRQALLNGDDGVIESLAARIRQIPSMFGLADHTPEYYAVLQPFLSLEERDLAWRI